MALSQPTLKAGILSALASGSAGTPEDFADALATAIIACIQSGTVTVAGTTAQACAAGGAVGSCAATGAVT